MENEQKQEKTEQKTTVAPVVERAKDEETTDAAAAVDFAQVIEQQSRTIAEQAKRIDSLLAAVSNFTAAGANYQQGERPTAPQPGETQAEREEVKTLAELDFKM